MACEPGGYFPMSELMVAPTFLPAEPLRKRAPAFDEHGKALSDFMVLIPGLVKKPQHLSGYRRTYPDRVRRFQTRRGIRRTQSEAEPVMGQREAGARRALSDLRGAARGHPRGTPGFAYIKNGARAEFPSASQDLQNNFFRSCLKNCCATVIRDRAVTPRPVFDVPKARQKPCPGLNGRGKPRKQG